MINKIIKFFINKIFGNAVADIEIVKEEEA